MQQQGEPDSAYIVLTTRRQRMKQLRISLGSIFLFISMKIAERHIHSGQRKFSIVGP